MAESRDPPTKYSQAQISEQESKIFHKSGLPRWSFHKNRSFGWMVLSLLSGIALSIGHHFFYAMFDGLQVEYVPISQTWIIRIGTVFAFAVKTLLVVAVSIAFVQHQFLALSNHQFKIRQIDTLTGVLGNALSFLESRIWLRFPLLTLLAGAAWLLPIAAIITPAAINVITTDHIMNVQRDPPQLYFDPNHYASLQTETNGAYVDPSPDTLRTAFGSAMTGQIQGIAQESPNMTYTLDFLGPALTCELADAAFIRSVYGSYMKDIGPDGYMYSYLSWVPSNPGGLNSSNLTSMIKEIRPTLDVVSPDAAHIYVIPNTSFVGPIFVGQEQMSFDDQHYGYQDTLECKLYNASYRAFFNLTFANQAIEIQSRELLNPVNVSTDINQWVPGNAYQEQRICYQSIMDAFGRLIVGSEMKKNGRASTVGSWNMMAIDWKTRNGTQQGLQQLFQNITLSMLSTPSLTMNSTIAAQNRVAVDIRTQVNIYLYEPFGLLLAYGIACSATLVATLLGIYGIWRNGGVGYQSIFSTFVRTTRDHVFRDLIDPNDHGTEPLPKKLAEASIVLDT